MNKQAGAEPFSTLFYPERARQRAVEDERQITEVVQVEVVYADLRTQCRASLHGA